MNTRGPAGRRKTNDTRVIVPLLTTPLASSHLRVITLGSGSCQAQSLHFPPPPLQQTAKRPKQETQRGQHPEASGLRHRSPSPGLWGRPGILMPSSFCLCPRGCQETSRGGSWVIFFPNPLCIQHMKTRQKSPSVLSFKCVIRRYMSLRRSQLAVQSFLIFEREELISGFKKPLLKHPNVRANLFSLPLIGLHEETARPFFSRSPHGNPATNL